MSLGHSGSTLLGNILGSHSQGMHIGELVSPIKKGKPMVCRSCIDKPCPVWGTILTTKYVNRVYNSFTSSGLRTLYLNYSGGIYKKLFSADLALNYIVDSSKNVKWYEYNSKNKKFKSKHIFLKRNPNAVVASYKRAYNKEVKAILPIIAQTLLQLNNYYDQIEPNDKLVIKYEELVSMSNKAITDVCGFLHIDFEPEMLNFNEHTHHLIGGNHGLLIQSDPDKIKAIDDLIDYRTPQKTIEYYKSLDGLQLDERWKTELTNIEKKDIDAELKDVIAY